MNAKHSKKLVLCIKYCLTIFGFLILLSSGQPLLAQNAFITTWKTDNSGSSADHQITIPGYGTNYSITWEEVGNPKNNASLTGSDVVTVTFPSAGIYKVSISGNFHRIKFNNAGDKLKLLTIEQWGAIEWSSMENAFYGCANLTYNASDAPNLTSVRHLTYMFRDCSNFNGAIGNWNMSSIRSMQGMFMNASLFNQPIGNWDTSQVSNMGAMFQDATSFNQPIGNWNTSRVYHMSTMFARATAFNQPIGNWDTSQVLYMISVFFDATSFNQPIGNWNTSNVTRMYGMFNGATSFNQPINNWNTSNVTDMYGMFRQATSFNQPINNWNTSNVTNMNNMFNSATSFNQPIGNWNTSNVINMSNMFNNATSFNQPVGDWNISNVTNMRYMFNNATSFNQPIGNWNMSQVTDITAMFRNAASFNQPIGNWNTSNVTNMRQMFDGATAFDQSLGNWDMTQVTDITLMLYQCGMGVESYDQTLIGWASQNVQNNLSLSAQGLSYCIGASARAVLTNQRNWTIWGDTSFCPEINLQHNGADVASGESVNMGDAYVGGASEYQTFTIENTGVANLVLSGTPKVKIEGLHPNDFTVVQDQLSSPIAPNTSQTFEVRFNPTQQGIRLASLKIYNNDSDENPYIVRLMGEALGMPDIHISQNGVEKPSGSVFNFGVVGIMHPSVPFEFVVRNTGIRNLVLQNGTTGFVTISGAHANDFRVTKMSTNSVLASGQTAPFVVQLYPSATGIRQATLTIYSNDPDENPYTILLEGASILDAVDEPKLQVSPNPTSDKLTLNTTQWTGEAIEVEIRNEQGRPTMLQTIQRAKDKITFDVSAYKAGWYVLMVNTKKGQYRYKFMKK